MIWVFWVFCAFVELWKEEGALRFALSTSHEGIDMEYNTTKPKEPPRRVQHATRRTNTHVHSWNADGTTVHYRASGIPQIMG